MILIFVFLLVFLTCLTFPSGKLSNSPEMPSSSITPLSLQANKNYVTLKTTFISSDFFNRSFARSGRMVQNKLCWDANNTRGLPKQRNFYQSGPTFLSFESPTALFTSQYNLFRLLSGQIKDKVITLANHKGHWQSSEPIKTSTKHMSVT